LRININRRSATNGEDYSHPALESLSLPKLLHDIDAEI